jgi:hypothetical protein
MVEPFGPLWEPMIYRIGFERSQGPPMAVEPMMIVMVVMMMICLITTHFTQVCHIWRVGLTYVAASG